MQTAILHDFEGDKDQANLRVVSLPDGIEVSIDRKDPYGLMSISFKDKKIPEELSGSYTTYEQARKAILAFWINKPKKKK